MPIRLRCQYDSSTRLEVESIRPEQTAIMRLEEIKRLPVWRGRRKGKLADFFEIEGETSEEIYWSGNLEFVDRIGEGMTSGKMVIDSQTGHHVGQSMSGGTVVARGNVGNFAGNSMTGGQVVVFGDAGDHLGATQPGNKRGMNRGSILVSGNIGRGAGQNMRRGTIVCGGRTGKLAGWNMIAGTLVSFEGFGQHSAAGMKRGTLVDCSPNSKRPKFLLPTFDHGICGRVPVLRMIRNWLVRQIENIAMAFPERNALISRELVHRISGHFQMYHGDRRNLGLGEVLAYQGDT